MLSEYQLKFANKYNIFTDNVKKLVPWFLITRKGATY